MKGITLVLAQLKNARLRLICYIRYVFVGGSELVQPQQLASREQSLPQHLSARLINRSDLRDAIHTLDGEQGLRVNVRVVQQIGAVTGDDNLGPLRSLAERREQDVQRGRVEGDFGLLQSNKQREFSPSVSAWKTSKEDAQGA